MNAKTIVRNVLRGGAAAVSLFIIGSAAGVAFAGTNGLGDIAVNVGSNASPYSEAMPYGDTLTFTLVPGGGFTVPETYGVSDSLSGSSISDTDVDASGDFSWTPTVADVGVHNLTFTVGDGGSDTGTLTMQVTIEAAPTASDGSATTNENTPISITLSASGSSLLTYSIVDSPTNGTLGAISENEVTYTPNMGYSGSDSFTFKANDGTNDSNIATISVTVNATPAVTTDAATSVTATDATLKGTNGPLTAGQESFWVSQSSPIDTSSTNIPAGVFSTPVFTAPASLAAAGTFSTALSTLNTDAITTGGATGVNLPAITPNTTYYYVAWSNVNGTWYPGTQQSVTTLSSDATLSNLTDGQVTMTPAFASNVLAYTDSVPASITSLNVTPTTNDSNAIVSVNGTTVTSGSATPVTLSYGSNTITVHVMAQDGSTNQTYTITVTRGTTGSGSTHGDTLSAIASSGGALSPTFAAGTLAYSQSVPNSVTSITLTPTVTDPSATITVDGNAITSGSASTPVPLPEGAATPIPVVVSIIAGNSITYTQTYTVTVTRAPSSDDTLSNLTVNGTGVTRFDPTTLSYNVVLPSGTIAVPTVAVTTDDTNATAVVTQATTLPGSATVLITAQDGITNQSYTINFSVPVPTITAINPSTVNYNDYVDIIGTGFGDKTVANGSTSDGSTVTIEQSPSQGEYIVSWSDTDIRVSVNNSNILGPISLVVGSVDLGGFNRHYSNAFPITLLGIVQTINFAALNDKTYGDADFDVSATASSNLDVTFDASGACTISGATVHITGVDTCTVTASQAGGGDYAAASDVTQSFTVNPASAAVTLGDLSQDYDGTAKSAAVTTDPSGLSTLVTYNGSLTIPTGVGSYAVVATITDPNYTGSGNGTLVISDVTPPVISGTPSNMTVQATSASGATVTYTTPTATDIVDGTDPVSCIPVSGSTFALGTTVVTCNASDAAGNTATPTTFNVVVNPVVVTGVTLNESSHTLTIGGIDQLTATIAPTDATNETVTYSSSDPTDASVSSSGLVTANAAGPTTITVTTTDGSKTATDAITVVSDVSALTTAKNVAQALITANAAESTTPGQHVVGSLATLSAALTAANATDADAQSVVDGQVATLDAAITAYNAAIVPVSNLSALTAEIATANTALVGVVEGTVPGNHVVGSSATLEAVITAAQAVTDTEAQSVVDAAVTTLTSAVSTFNAAIVPAVPVTGVTLNESTNTLTVGNTDQLTTTIAPVGATNQAITYTSDTPTVATVSATGLITAVAAGTATITVTTTDGSFTATDAITVNAAAVVAPVVSSGGGGGGNGPISGGGGGGPVAVALPNNGGGAPGSGTVTTTTTGSTGTGGQVLGASAYNFANDLTIGSTGNDVTQLQTMLIADGYLKVNAPTGYFGSMTQAAVKAYQTANGITPVSGYVGPKTRAILNQGVLPTTPETSSTMVQKLQAELQALEAQIAALEASSTSATSTATQ